MVPFTQYKQWMIERYGDALFRVPVEIASTCPHGRCAFCSENGARAQQTQRQENPIDQIEAAIKFSKRRYKAQKLMLYVQAFTADMTSPEQQKLILQCLENYRFEAISIGTRPDCLPEAAIHFLETLKTPAEVSGPTACCRLGDPTRREVWVELGVQTANDETLKRINRGHDWECSKKAILALAARGIHVAPHIIIGLPGETSDDWNHTAEELTQLPISGIKIHNLHVMKGTELAKKPPPVLNHWEYAEALMEFLRRIPAKIPVMRISTDTPDEELVAPHWHLEKGQFLDYVIQQMTMREIRQGDLCGRGFQPLASGKDAASTLPVTTDDGSITFFSEDWKEHYHTKTGARLEAEKKFVEPSGLVAKLQNSNLKLLDVCFGLGNNSLAALCATKGASHQLDITALEVDKRVVRAAAECFQTLETDPVDWKKTLTELLKSNQSVIGNHQLAIRWGDARRLIQSLEAESFDIVFHDPFSSQHCPELWTVEFFQQLYRVMKPDGVLLTYSSSLPVRGAMIEAGFMIGETKPGHPMGNGTIAAKRLSDIEFPITEKPDARRSIPYRDPYLCATSKTILRNRQEAIE
ncbi:MAG: TIGR01212 family radical SAM protein [Kiritimatiellaceae bacterium]|nr:TIGR01212 family radical SAM protein [Kiritimatiellaceae bacterium]